MTELTLGEILNSIDLFPWNNWVFIEVAENISSATPCLVLATADAETGSDGFTPLQAEKRHMSEFLSIQDLKDILEVLERSTNEASIELKCAAAAYYFENDAFMPPQSMTGA